MPNKNTTLANLANIVNVDSNAFPTTVKVANLPIATSSVVGIAKPDNVTITVDSNGVLTVIGGGGGGSFSSVNVVWTNSNSATKTAYSAPNVTNNDGLTFNLVASTSPGPTLDPATISLNSVPVAGTFNVTGAFPNYGIIVPVGAVSNLPAQTASSVSVTVQIGSRFNLPANALTNLQPVAFTATVSGSFQNNSYPFYISTASVVITSFSNPSTPTAFTLSIAGQNIPVFSGFVATGISIFAPAPTITGTVTGNGLYGAGSSTVTINRPVSLPSTFIPAFYIQTSDSTPPVFTISSQQTPGQAAGATITYPIATLSSQYNWIATTLPLTRILFVTSFGNSQFIPDVTAPTQTISGQTFSVYGFTRLDTSSPAQLFMTAS